MRLWQKFGRVDGKGNTAKMYRNAAYDEFVVKFYTDGVHHVDADYFTNDQTDAKDTAYAQLKAMDSRKSNPAKKRAVRRKGVTGSKYVARRSQMTGKPPTKRLKKRRAKVVAAPKKGYFPNPGKVRVIRENPAPLVYYVHPLVERTSAQYMHGGSIARAPFDHDDVEQWKIASSRVAPKRQNLFVIPTERMDMKAFRAWYSENHKKLIMGSLNDIKRALRPFLLKK